jgi:hypothetical protein
VSPEEMRIAIAEACGRRVDFWGYEWQHSDKNRTWHLSRPYLSEEDARGAMRDTGRWGPVRWVGAIKHASIAPDYLNDLNAMHEAEKALTEEQHGSYRINLAVICGYDILNPGNSDPKHYRRYVSATAAQRAEAFCRTVYPERFS